MSWRDFLRKASFRGVPFFVESSDSTHGRKTAAHEYPGKDQNNFEDLGKATPTYSVVAFVAGDLYSFQKKALIEAFETAGPGRLVHPYFGTIDVVVPSPVTVSESTRNGGMASISVDFVKAADPKFPRGLLSDVANLVQTAVVAFAAAKNNFDDAFTLIRQPAAIVNGTLAAASSAISSVESAFITIKNVAGFKESIDRLKGLVAAGTFTADEFADDIIALFTLNIEGDPLEAEKAIIEKLDMDDFGAGSESVTANVLAINSLIRVCAVTGAAHSSSTITFDSKQSAAQIKDLFVTSFDSVMAFVDDEDYEILHDLRGALLKDINDRSINLPTVQNKKLNIALSSLQVAYDLYEDADRAEDVADRNAVLHPGIMPRNVNLEVLSRV